jgi:glycosyltransferase involved in cell wall biosynthesis
MRGVENKMISQVELKKPVISVIIIAHDRRDFILEAIQSVLNQTLEKSLYEIIVVKNFKDEEIDKFIAGKNIQNLYTLEPEHGKKIAVGILHSNGEIIALLDDDDLFEIEKLKTVLDEFLKDEKLAYFHNYQRFFSKENNVIKPYFEIYDNTITVREMKQYLKTFIKKHYYGPLFFNCSSIVIKKKYYQELFKTFENIKIHTDDMLFLLLLGNGDDELKMHFDSRPLTLYRIHESSTNPLNSINNEKMEKILKNYINDTTILLNSIKDEKIKKFVRCRLINEKIRLNILIKNNVNNEKRWSLVKERIICFNYAKGNFAIRTYKLIKDAKKILNRF